MVIFQVDQAFDPGAMPDTWEPGPGPMTDMGPEAGKALLLQVIWPGPDGPDGTSSRYGYGTR